MNRLEQTQKLKEYYQEATEIVSRHDGVHEAHCLRGRILNWWKLSEWEEYQVVWKDVDQVMRKLRHLDQR